ncbi:MAG: DUF3467 domain-containing protein [Deltaproteobacteria bacterium]|nr:DUF3467 domain-containing protein [Deltaproteobacteria bacterium]
MAGPEKRTGKRTLPVKIKDDVLGGVYANNMMVGHTREEFVVDFIYAFPQGGVVNARVITSPGHVKRIIRALSDNLKKYEQRFGEIKEANEPKPELVVN